MPSHPRASICPLPLEGRGHDAGGRAGDVASMKELVAAEDDGALEVVSLLMEAESAGWMDGGV